MKTFFPFELFLPPSQILPSLARYTPDEKDTVQLIWNPQSLGLVVYASHVGAMCVCVICMKMDLSEYLNHPKLELPEDLLSKEGSGRFWS